MPVMPAVVDVTVASMPAGLEEELNRLVHEWGRKLRLRVGSSTDLIAPIGFVRVESREPTEDELRRLILLTVDQEELPLDIRGEARRRLESGESPLCRRVVGPGTRFWRNDWR